MLEAAGGCWGGFWRLLEAAENEQIVDVPGFQLKQCDRQLRDNAQVRCAEGHDYGKRAGSLRTAGAEVEKHERKRSR